MTSRKGKRSTMLLVLIVFLVSIMGVAFPQQTAHATKAESGTSSIKDKLTSTDGLETQVDKSTNTFIDKARHVGIFVTVILFLWLGYCFLVAGFSPDTLRQTKIIWMAFLGFLAFTFWTENILGFAFGIFGIDVQTILK
ncbi:hypothetical protein [Paenibacillus sp. WLX2291]|uniref:hypothetical protein n=1 Tax=Paenibacillus sp. WLX2291 TaxID=3296934 RepID=UPI003983ECD9